ncbi:MAG: NAD(P)-dependent oxidoreductase [Thermoplasmatota archaeon]
MARSPRKSTRKPSSRKTASRPKRAAKRAKPSSRGARRPARSSKPQRKAKAPARRTKPTRKAAKRSAKSAPRKAAARPSTQRPASRPAAKRLRVVLFGAGGMMGSRIANEAITRGHHVVAVQRNPGGLDLDGRHVLTVAGDATDPASVAALAKGADAVVSAVSPRDPPGADTLARAAKALLAGSRKAGVKRLVVVGGAGSLSVGPSTMLIDSPQFPDEYKPEAREHIDALHVYRAEGQGVDWTFVSPAAMVFPGKRTGKYQAGNDELLVDSSGQSQISAEDYAVALVDELERGRNKGRRMAVAWP